MISVSFSKYAYHLIKEYYTEKKVENAQIAFQFWLSVQIYILKAKS